jgi:hypothetical protein
MDTAVHEGKAAMISESFVKKTIESAGRTLAMLPRGFGSAPGVKSTWPETMREMLVFMNDEGDGLEIIMPELEEVKPKPSLREITELETVFDWMVDLASYCRRRELLHLVPAVWLGMLHHPVTGKRIYSWKRLGKRLGRSRQTAERWYEDGIRIITRNQNLYAEVRKKTKTEKVPAL